VNAEGTTFHDLRRAALSKWFASGLREHDVMVLAGHARFSTTYQFFLAVRRNLVDRARRVASFWHAPRARCEFPARAVDNESGKLLHSSDLGYERP
jgi:integrase